MMILTRLILRKTLLAPTCFWNFVISLPLWTFQPDGRNMLWQKRPRPGNKTLNIPISLLFIRVLGLFTKREK